MMYMKPTINESKKKKEDFIVWIQRWDEDLKAWMIIKVGHVLENPKQYSIKIGKTPTTSFLCIAFSKEIVRWWE
jgi:hypothetical protein